MKKVKKLIEEFGLEIGFKNGQKGLRPRREKEKCKKNIEEIREMKNEIIEYLENEKKEKELEKEKKYVEMLKKNTILNLGLVFTNYGKSVYGLPEELVENEKIIIDNCKFNQEDPFENEWTLKIKINDLIQKIQKIKDERNQKKVEKENKEKEIFKKAKNINLKQILKQFSIPCQDKNEECNIDNVILYAMPDGTTKKVISHTW